MHTRTQQRTEQRGEDRLAEEEEKTRNQNLIYIEIQDSAKRGRQIVRGAERGGRNNGRLQDKEIKNGQIKRGDIQNEKHVSTQMTLISLFLPDTLFACRLLP